MKIGTESPTFLECIQGDICGAIQPPYGPFKYFMVLINASTRELHVSLLSSCNLTFARLLTQLIRLQAHFSHYPTKKVCLNNTGEFTSRAFNDCCMSIRIDVEHLVTHVHIKNGLVELFVKHLQLIVRPLIMRSNLPIST